MCLPCSDSAYNLDFELQTAEDQEVPVTWMHEGQGRRAASKIKLYVQPTASLRDFYNAYNEAVMKEHGPFLYCCQAVRTQVYGDYFNAGRLLPILDILDEPLAGLLKNPMDRDFILQQSSEPCCCLVTGCGPCRIKETAKKEFYCFCPCILGPCCCVAKLMGHFMGEFKVHGQRLDAVPQKGSFAPAQMSMSSI
mmetsp:Transcript_33485/g.92527  ORF Transcript_33485/g.92527 Transcript_33485/m.92527 type:complete len:194 (-) Transcript_33485:56-637(-)